MKIRKTVYFSDAICGKETSDYIGEYSPHRLSVIRFEENSEKIIDLDENKPILKVKTELMPY